VPGSRNPQTGYLLVVSAAVLFVVNAGVSRVIQAAGVDSMTLTTTRCTGTAIALVVVVVARGERLTLPRTMREISLVVAFGVTGVALVQYFYFVAIDRLPVGIALLLEFTAPVLVALYARFVRREPVRRRMWLALACSLTGLALVAEVWQGLRLDGVGVLAGFAAAASLAAYFLLGEHSIGAETPLHVLTKAFIVATVFWNIVKPVTSLWQTDLTEPRDFGGTLSGLSAPGWLLVVWLVIFGTVLPFLFELTAMRHLSATEVSLVGMVEPVGAAILGWLWFREDLSALQLAGIVVALVGIGLAQTARIVRPAAPGWVPTQPGDRGR
jgi:drug/metabolite transporter (DMT)-like permease